MLPALRTDRLSLADIMPGCLSAVIDGGGPFAGAQVRSAIVVVIDGLGAISLRAHAGHARNLTRGFDRSSVIDSGFPTTTASALASLTTGHRAGEHGLVGYTVLDPEGDRVVNLLNAWEGIDPTSWQPVPTVFERSAELGVRALAIGPGRFRGSSYTRAALRGARYVGAESIADRFDAAAVALRDDVPTLVYLYIAELDKAGHAEGVDSAAWVRRLEEIDAEFGRFVSTLKPDQGVVVTADHGMVDIAHHAHRLLGERVDDARLRGVRHVAGEPRCLQLHLDPGVDPHAVAERWREEEGANAWVTTREEAIAAGWFGVVDPAISPRIGGVLVAARRAIAYYDARSTTSLTGRRMVGQHGSLTPEEVRVPLLRRGAFEA